MLIMKKVYINLKSIKDDESGSIVVIVAVAMTLVLALAALVLDFGLAYMKTAEIQNVADSAALSAGQKLPIPVNNDVKIADIKNCAIEYAMKNGVDDLSTDDVTLENIVSGNYTAIKVNIPATAELNFSRVIGFNNISINRTAKAVIQPCTKADGIVPLGVEIGKLNAAIASGQTTGIILKYGTGDNGFYGAIDLDGVKGGGANDYSLWLAYGYTSTISVGEDLLPIESGNMSGPTNSAFWARYNQCTHYPGQGGCTKDHFVPTCPRVIKTIVYEIADKKYVDVKGFCAFILEGKVDDNIKGSLIKFVTNGSPSHTNAGSGTDYGLYNLGLSN